MGFFKDLSAFFAVHDPQMASAEYSSDLQAAEKILEGLPAEKARYLASLALLLGRVAYVDQEITENEREHMIQIFRQMDLDPALSQALADLALQRTLLHNLEEHLVLRQIKSLTQKPQRLQVMRALLSLAAKNDINPEENQELQRIAKWLDFSDREYYELRLEFRAAIPTLRS